MIKSYNNFTTGESQDDFLTAGGRLLETYGVTGLRDGHGLTLGAKTNKAIITNDKIKGIELPTRVVDNDNDRNLVFGDTGEIYRISDTDSTPSYTHTSGWEITGFFIIGAYGYFIARNPTGSSSDTTIMRESTSNIYNGTFATIDETWLASGDISNFFNMPILGLAKNIYIGGNGTIHKYDTSATKTDYAYFGRYVVGITIHSGTFVVYTDNGTVYYWNGLLSSDANYSNNGQELGFNPRKVTQIAGIDYVISDDGQLYIGGGTEFQQLTYKRQTNRGNDNSQYVTKQDFTPNYDDGQLLTIARDRLFIAENGVYEYGQLFPGLSKGLHKSIVYNHEGTAIDDIYSINYNPINRQILFGYKAGTTYGVDYIDLDSKETNEDGYAVTEVFAGYNEGVITFEKKIQALRYASINSNGNNYIKLYKRINNGDWELFETINEGVSTIKHKELRTQKDILLDVQFKIELHNDDKGENPPILPGLELQYEVLPR